MFALAPYPLVIAFLWWFLLCKLANEQLVNQQRLLECQSVINSCTQRYAGIKRLCNLRDNLYLWSTLPSVVKHIADRPQNRKSIRSLSCMIVLMSSFCLCMLDGCLCTVLLNRPSGARSGIGADNLHGCLVDSTDAQRGSFLQGLCAILVDFGLMKICWALILQLKLQTQLVDQAFHEHH